MVFTGFFIAVLRGRSSRRPLGKRDCVDQNESDYTRCTRSVGPGMVCPALHQYIASDKFGFADIHDSPDLAGEHDGVIDRSRAVHVGMADLAALARGFGGL